MEDAARVGEMDRPRRLLEISVGRDRAGQRVVLDTFCDRLTPSTNSIVK